MDPDTPPPSWLSVGTSPCSYPSRTNLFNTLLDLKPALLGSCTSEPHPSISLHVTRNLGKYRNQSSEGPWDLPKPPQLGGGYAERNGGRRRGLKVEQNEGSSVSVQDRVNEGGVDTGPRGPWG